MRIATIAAICGAIMVSCQSDSSGCTTTSAPPPAPLSSQLAPRYRLSTVGIIALPAVYADSAGFDLKVYADTLFLRLTDSTYTESGLISRINRSTNLETSQIYSLTGLHKFARTTSGTLLFPIFLGGTSATATISPSTNFAIITLRTQTGQIWTFIPSS